MEAEKLAPNLTDMWQCRCNYPKPETNEQLAPEFLDGKGRLSRFPFGKPYFQVQFVSFREGKNLHFQTESFPLLCSFSQ